MNLCNFFLFAFCFSSYSSFANTTLESVSTCVNPKNLSFIVDSLTNINSQMKEIESLRATAASTANNISSQMKEIESLKDTAASTANNINSQMKEIESLRATAASTANNISSQMKEIESLRDTAASTAKVTNEIKSHLDELQSQISSLSLGVERITLLLRHVNLTVNDKEEAPSSPLLPSCEAILSKWPNSPSGYYSLVDVNGHTRHVYCHMETLCGKGGGWRRIASLNMKNSNEKCPTQFRAYSQDGVRACGRPATSRGSCVGIEFLSRDIKYSQVCGKVIGYQYYTTDATRAFSGFTDINSPYVDGISLTYGVNPRKHIWTFASGGQHNGPYNRCPCGSTSAVSMPQFVGSDYYCESGQNVKRNSGNLYTYDPLWDGKDCGSSETNCCQRSLIPWFYKSFGYSTTDAIEMRVCCDQDTSDEDVTFEQYELYVK